MSSAAADSQTDAIAPLTAATRTLDAGNDPPTARTDPEPIDSRRHHRAMAWLVCSASSTARTDSAGPGAD